MNEIIRAWLTIDHKTIAAKLNILDALFKNDFPEVEIRVRALDAQQVPHVQGVNVTPITERA